MRVHRRRWLSSAVLVVLLLSTVAASLKLEGWVAASGSRLVEETLQTATQRRSIVLEGCPTADVNLEEGRAAWEQLQELLERGDVEVVLRAGEADLAFDGQGRAYATARVSSSGRMLAEVLKAPPAGVDAEEDAEDKITEALLSHEDEREIYLNATFRPAVSMGTTTTTMTTTTQGGDPSSAAPTAERQLSDTTRVDAIGLPSGFKKEQISDYRFTRPVDLVFPPGRDGKDIILAENNGLIKYIRNDRVLPNDVLDLSSLANFFQDRGVLNIQICPTFNRDQRLYVFFVYEHRPGPRFFEGPKTSTVMRTQLSGTTERPDSRRFILGTVHGDGCGDLPADSDCLSADGKSHVGGALACNSRGELFVAVGDGTEANVNELALRAQDLTSLSGKLLRIDPDDGRGYRRNPFFRSGTDGLNSRRAKIFALGFRNPHHCHVSPNSDEVLFCADTQWSRQEEVDRVHAGGNYGWPCYEASLFNRPFRDFDTCRNLPESAVTRPLVEWAHTEFGTHASTCGPKLDIPSWPALYRDALVYGDIAAGWIGFAHLNGRGELLQDVQRVAIAENPIQFRVSPDGALYYADVSGASGLHRITYEPSSAPVRINATYPEAGSMRRLADAEWVSMTFSRTLDPRTVEQNVVLLDVDRDRRVPATVTHNYYESEVDLLPRDGYTPGTRYRVVVTRGVRDLDGNRVPVGLSWSFTALRRRPSLETTPEVVHVAPTQGATDVPIDAWMDVFFDQSMDETSFVDGTVVLQEFSGARTPEGPPLTLRGAVYRASTQQYRFRAELRFVTTYVVTIKGGDAGPKNVRGEAMDRARQFSFTTGRRPRSPIRVVITEPKEGRTVNVGDRVRFAGRATMHDEPVPSSAITWNVLIEHCKYYSNICHDHTNQQQIGIYSGAFTAPDHEDQFFYRLEMSVEYRDEQASDIVTLKVNQIPFTIDSRPSGATLNLNGFPGRAPLGLPVGGGSLVQLSAPDRFRGEAFTRWSCAGGRETRVQVTTPTSGRFQCFALYGNRSAPGGPAPTLAPVPTSVPPTPPPENPRIRNAANAALVDLRASYEQGSALPTTGFFPVRLSYRTTLPTRLNAGIRDLEGRSFGGDGVNIGSTRNLRRSTSLSFRLKSPLQSGRTYVLRGLLSPSGGGRAIASFVQQFTVP